LEDQDEDGRILLKYILETRNKYIFGGKSLETATWNNIIKGGSNKEQERIT
jgi:hypothetical protein